MPDLPTLAAGSILGSLVLYALLGGADFGAGVWDLLGGRGPRAEARSAVIAGAIGPVWETNHIWVIVAVVVLFTAFPQAFAVISVSLFVPVTLMLAGIVLRGAAFAFHHYQLHEDGGRRRWGTLFAGASLLTPVLLGVIVGAVSSGDIRAQTSIGAGAYWGWFAPFPLAVGALTLALFSYLAAVYLIFETRDPDLQEEFRTFALRSWAVVAALLLVALLLARSGAPDFYRSLMGSDWSAGIVFLVATAALGAGVSLRLRSYGVARACAAAQTILIIAGWGAAQYPFLLRPDLAIPSAASPPATLRLILITLAAGALFLFPSLFALLRIFKREVLFEHPRNTPPED